MRARSFELAATPAHLGSRRPALRRPHHSSPFHPAPQQRHGVRRRLATLPTSSLPGDEPVRPYVSAPKRMYYACTPGGPYAADATATSPPSPYFQVATAAAILPTTRAHLSAPPMCTCTDFPPRVQLEAGRGPRPPLRASGVVGAQPHALPHRLPGVITGTPARPPRHFRGLTSGR